MLAHPAALTRGAALLREAFGGFATVAGLFTLAFAPVTAVLGRRLLGALRRRPALKPLPPVTVLKPLKGAEAGLYENLASFCRQDYPCFQLLFCLQSPEDPALAVVSRLKRDFPGVDMEVVVSRNRIGYNPKVNNMANAYPFAKYDLLLMSDCDVLALPDLLSRMAAPFADPAVGLVTSFYEATGSHGLWGHLEALSINASFLPRAMAAASCGMRFAMGAAMMVRRAAFEASGAFANLADHIADDFWLGESIREAGWRIEISAGAVESVPDIRGAAEHFRHLVRWARTIRVCQPAGYAASVVEHGFTLLTLKAVLLGPDPLTLALLGAIWAAKASASLDLGAALAGSGAGLGGRQPARALLLLPLAEWLAFAAWTAGWGSTRVHWRGEDYEVQPQGRLTPVPAALRAPVPVEP
ncbi:MAG: bacteriohopanetetrol glucosamine biosynthesis glycosyltransferase HpnI [Elusimicrobia bacterium]|nr:bacteriohopanetetrol glucosamine biosynthesis glycosyltransferase HpnI [Elusimicrobiota bacterium]